MAHVTDALVKQRRFKLLLVALIVLAVVALKHYTGNFHFYNYRTFG